MRNGRLPRSVEGSLPAGSIEQDYAPDGLSGPVLDSLIEQAYAAADAPAAPRPRWLSPDVTEQRGARRRVRQMVRALPSVLRLSHATDPDEGEAA
jgi:hypothetical protein